MAFKTPIPYFPTPPQAYSREYMNDVSRSFAQFSAMVRNLSAELSILEDDMKISPLVHQAERETLETYGDTVSVEQKAKSLLKFGENKDIDTSRETIWTQGGDETYVTTNAIDRISSSDAGDTGTFTIEYHTVSGSGSSQQFTFGTQTVTLTGQTPATLTTPCARVSRGYPVSAATAGDIYVFENSSVSSGVPTDATKIHLKVEIADQQSFKAATTISNVDYAFISQVHASVKKVTSAVADVRVELRPPGGVFLPKIEFSVSQTSGTVVMPIVPMLIVPKNYDVRMTSDSSTSNVDVNAGFSAYLASVVS